MRGCMGAVGLRCGCIKDKISITLLVNKNAILGTNPLARWRIYGKRYKKNIIVGVIA